MLFLSYAEEDGDTGLEVAKWLADQGFDVYYWQDPRRRGGRFIEQIEKAIGEADAFVALLSPSFLRSTWCRQERDMALRREHALRAGAPEMVFVHVLKVGDMPAESAGLLGSYDWTDLTSPRHRDQALRDLAGRLGPSRGETGNAPLAAAAPDRAAVKRESYGHRAELDHVVRGLTSASGPHFWLVTAPPGLGKSRFLRRLSAAMSGPGTRGWATHLVDVQEQPSDVRGDANALLARLLGRTAGAGPDAQARPDINQLRGDACLRVPARVREGQRYFRQALAEAEALTSEDRSRLVARAHNELGFYYRNAGEWANADRSYEQARDVLSATLTPHSPDEDRLQMASIQANWAYLKGLVGRYRDGSYLVASAIAVQHRLVRRMEEGISWSVCGEVYRYERRFQKAWDAYAEAEQIFLELKNWPGLGIVYQEQAICVFQAADDAVVLVPDRAPDELTRRLVTMALDICRDQSVRAYPSALNRAGRIFGRRDHEAGLRYLADGIDSARSLSDGWFWFANLIEYVELCYRAWLATAQGDYLEKIAARTPDIDAVMEQYAFPDLRGRWRLLQGHLAVHRSLQTGDAGPLDAALEYYRAGFAMIAGDYIGSSGASAIPAEFRRFRDLLMRLPPDVQARWLSELRRAWSDERAGSTLLLALIEELY